MTFKNIIENLKQKKSLNEAELSTIYKLLESKSLNDEEIIKLVLLWKEKEETAFEISTLANLINSNQGQITKYSDAVDVCGTGGDRLNTFNISTITAIVASSLGMRIIKHSGRSSTSIAGSVDILNEFNINLTTSKEKKEKCFEKYNLMFVSSKTLVDVFGDIKRISKKLGKPSLTNLLGPLTNPYKTSFHLLGVNNIKAGELLTKVLVEEKKKILTVCSEISPNLYLDELSLSGINHLWEYEESEKIKKIELTAKGLGVNEAELNNLKIKDKAESKLIFESVLKGKVISKKLEDCINIVALNTSAAIYLLKKVNSIKEGYSLALKHIQTGNCWEHFQEFVNFNR